jgi:hypothetical protein
VRRAPVLDEARGADRDRVKDSTDDLMRRIAQLLPEQHRGRWR